MPNRLKELILNELLLDSSTYVSPFSQGILFKDMQRNFQLHSTPTSALGLCCSLALFSARVTRQNIAETSCFHTLKHSTILQDIQEERV